MVKQKGPKYVAVSVVNVIIGQGLLLFFHAILHINQTLANVLAVCISAVPAYYMSRAWVWGRKGKSHFKTEVLPFWIFIAVGLIFSTIDGGRRLRIAGINGENVADLTVLPEAPAEHLEHVRLRHPLGGALLPDGEDVHHADLSSPKSSWVRTSSRPSKARKLCVRPKRPRASAPPTAPDPPPSGSRAAGAGRGRSRLHAARRRAGVVRGGRLGSDRWVADARDRQLLRQVLDLSRCGRRRTRHGAVRRSITIGARRRTSRAGNGTSPTSSTPSSVRPEPA